MPHPMRDHADRFRTELLDLLRRAPEDGREVPVSLLAAHRAFLRAYGGKLDDFAREAWQRLVAAWGDDGAASTEAIESIEAWLVANFIHPLLTEEEPNVGEADGDGDVAGRATSVCAGDALAGLCEPQESRGGAAE